MKALSWLRARPKALASAAGVTVGVVAITTMAFTYEGFPTTKVDLNDGGVWITKTSSLLVGHFNHESTIIDGGLRTTGENYDILQDAANILVVDESASTVTAVDPSRVSLGDSAGIPAGAKVALGAQTAAILEPAVGQPVGRARARDRLLRGGGGGPRRRARRELRRRGLSGRHRLRSVERTP
ncbi:hypothetical protein [Microbacterium sp. W4I20]|uniref:hypothetical protein n=1 Tax=Microbacterium sp. W4I20 TaxID=3042262 RepID=UPI002781446E|nr:hypothetical protein [Microbacterium sp. W4I20]MDQ0726929.1 hypothetical protein [Microbacterium sp. W4I20]